MSETGYDGRFDRIESKIDKLSDAMIALARAEERLVNLEAHNSHQYKRVNRLAEKVDEVEICTRAQGTTIKIIHRISWLLVVVGIGAVVSLLMG